jgi:hypothetical protein
MFAPCHCPACQWIDLCLLPPLLARPSCWCSPHPCLGWEVFCLQRQTQPWPRSSSGDPCPVVQHDCPSPGTNPQQHPGATGCQCLTHSHLGPLCWQQSQHCGNQNMGSHGPSPQVCWPIPCAAQWNPPALLLRHHSPPPGGRWYRGSMRCPHQVLSNGHHRHCWGGVQPAGRTPYPTCT